MDAELADLRQGLLRLRSAVADLRTTLAGRRLIEVLAKANFDPDQPRVPAGFSDGGQWTGADDPRIGSGLVDPEGEGGDVSTILVAAADRPPYGQYTVDLLEEEALAGGHAISRHVDKSEGYMIRSVRAMTEENRYRIRYLAAHGSFRSLQTAGALVNKMLSDQRDIVDKIATGEFNQARFRRDFFYVTGREAYRTGGPKSPIRFRSTTSAVVIIRHDPSIKKGYRVVTAFPTNQLIEDELKSMIPPSPSALFYFGHCLTFEEWNKHKTNESFLVELPLKYMRLDELKDIQRYIETFLKGDPSENACRQLWDREGNPLIRFRGNNAYRSFLEDIRDTLPRWSPDELAAKSRATSPKRRHNHERPTG